MVRIVVVAVDIAAVADVAFQPVHRQVEAAEAAGFVGLLDAVDGQLGRGVAAVFGHEARRLHEHAAGAAGRVEDAAVERFADLGQQLDDAAGRVELAALLSLRARELPQEVFVDAAKGVEVHAGRNLGDLAQQFLEQRGGEEVVALGQHAGQQRVVLFDLAHGRVDAGADVGRFGQGQQMVEARRGRQVKHAGGVIGGRFVQATAAAGAGLRAGQAGALRRKAHLGEAQEDEAQDGAGILLRLQPGVSAELIGRVPQALFQRGGGGILFGAGNPMHRASPCGGQVGGSSWPGQCSYGGLRQAQPDGGLAVAAFVVKGCDWRPGETPTSVPTISCFRRCAVPPAAPRRQCAHRDRAIRWHIRLPEVASSAARREKRARDADTRPTELQDAGHRPGQSSSQRRPP